jgi:hypothetical protein
MHQIETTPQILKNLLKEGVVEFSFIKKDGSRRDAIGTTNLSSIPAESHPQGVRESSDKVVTFFDLEKREWRSVSTLREIYL